MVLAILEARHGLSFSTAEVYLNVSGGYKLSDPGADLAVAAALVSAFAEKPVSTDAVIFGELALSGEVRPIAHMNLRLKESSKLRSEEHTSELQSLMRISYAVFCLKKKTKKHSQNQ